MRVVGIDLGQGLRHTAAVVVDRKPVGRSFTFTVDPEGLEALIRRATADGAEPEVSFVMEPTGTLWPLLCAFLEHEGYPSYVVPTRKVSNMRKALNPHHKTDGIDAVVIATLAEADPDSLRKANAQSPAHRMLTQWVKKRANRAEDIERVKKRIGVLVHQAIPGLVDRLKDGLYSKTTLAFLSKYLDPAIIVRRGPEALREFWRTHGKGRGRVNLEHADAIYEVCVTAEGWLGKLRVAGKLPHNYPTLLKVLREEIRQLSRLEQDVTRIEKTNIKPMYFKLSPSRILEEIPGIGIIIAATLIALIGDIRRFVNAAAFIGFTGLAPCTYQSGRTDKPLRITKAGNPLLRKYLYLAAEVARRHDPELAKYYGRLYSEGKHHKRIMTAIARKLALRVYAVLVREAEAEEAAQAGTSAPAPGYVLRDPETGESVDKATAREIIRERYARDAVAPERAAKDRLKSEGTGNGKVKKSGRQRRHRSLAVAPSRTEGTQAASTVQEPRACSP